MKKLKDISRYMSLILRHKPEDAGIVLDDNGWTSVDLLTKALKIDKNDLDWIVATNSKGRFEYNEDQKVIRACQGHTVNVDLKLEYCVPPTYLYHGTSTDSYNSIMTKGIKPMNRTDVHLSIDEATAINVAKRKGTPKILIIDALKAYNEGVNFRISSNNVYLTDYIDPKYIL